MTHNRPSDSGEPRHYWVSTAPFFSASLVSCCQVRAEANEVDAHCTSLRLFDPDGAAVNEVRIELTPGQVNVLELDPLLESCKIESGIKHAHLELVSGISLSHTVRVHNTHGASLMGELLPVGGLRRVCYPLVLHGQRDTGEGSFLVLVNYKDQEASVRARLFAAGRSPEELLTLPPKACRLFDLQMHFPEVIERVAGRDAKVQAYLRLSARGESVLGTQLLSASGTRTEGQAFIGMM